MDGFTTQEKIEVAKALDKTLGPEFVSEKPDGRGGKLQYIPGNIVIDFANRTFGFDGWSSRIVKVSTEFVEEHVDKQGRKSTSVGVLVISRVTIRGGAYHEDVGFAKSAKTASKIQALEDLVKAAATDALKRALRKFGNLTGNCLYDGRYKALFQEMKQVPDQNYHQLNVHRATDPLPQALGLRSSEAQPQGGACPSHESFAEVNHSIGATPTAGTDGGVSRESESVQAFSYSQLPETVSQRNGLHLQSSPAGRTTIPDSDEPEADMELMFNPRHQATARSSDTTKAVERTSHTETRLHNSTRDVAPSAGCRGLQTEPVMLAAEPQFLLQTQCHPEATNQSASQNPHTGNSDSNGYSLPASGQGSSVAGKRALQSVATSTGCDSCPEAKRPRMAQDED